MSRLAIIALALLMLVMPASAEKVAYLLEETGQINIDLFVDLPDEPDYQESFQDNGPFFESLTHTWWRSPYFGDDQPTFVEGGASLSGSFASLVWSSDGEYPVSADGSWELSWRFLVADEPMQAGMFVEPVGTSTASITDEGTSQSWPATEDDSFVGLIPGHTYVWNMHLQIGAQREWADAAIWFDGNFEFVPEPLGCALLGLGFILLLLRRHRFVYISLSLCTVVIGLASPRASGSTYYVSPDGNDSNPGTISQPWLSLRPFTNATRYAGDICYLRGGTYNWTAPPDSDKTRNIIQFGDGNDGNPIQIVNYPNESPVIQWNGAQPYGERVFKFKNVQWWVLRGLKFERYTRPVYLDNDGYDGASNITIDSCEFDCDVAGTHTDCIPIYIDDNNEDYDPPSYITISNNLIYNGSYGPGIKGMSGINHITIVGNTIHDIDDLYGPTADGIMMETHPSLSSARYPDQITISGNTIYRCNDDGIDIKSCGSVTIEDNTVYHCRCDCIKVWSTASGENFSDGARLPGNFTVTNNIAWGAGQVVFEAFYYPNLTATGNLFESDDSSPFDDNEYGEGAFLYKWFSNTTAPTSWTATCYTRDNVFRVLGAGGEAIPLQMWTLH